MCIRDSSYIVFIGPLDSGLSIRVNGIPEAFASLPEWVVFCIRAVQGMGPSWFLLQLFVLSACLAGIRKADKKGRLSALGEKCTLPILLLLYFPVLASAQILYLSLIHILAKGMEKGMEKGMYL